MPANKPIPILFTHYGDDWIRGSEIILLDLMRALDREAFEPIVWCNGKEMQRACQEAGFPTYRTDFRPLMRGVSSGKCSVGFWKTIAECRSICKSHNIRVLHSNSAAPTQWLVPVARSLRLPLLTHMHIDYLRRSRYAFLLHASTVLVGVSKHVLLGPEADGVPLSRLRVIYNGIDFERLGAGSATVRNQLDIPAKSFVVLSAGSLIDRKGFDVLIRAFSELPENEPSSHLVILGDGSEKTLLRALVAELNLNNRIHFVGHVRNTADYYVDADVFALASRAESFGLVLAEAGYFGLASVATGVGGIPEVVVDQETGLLVDREDVIGFTEKLQMLRTDQTLRLRLGAAAVRRVQENFSMEKMVQEFERLYVSLTKVPRRSLGWGAMGKAITRSYVNLFLNLSRRR